MNHSRSPSDLLDLDDSAARIRRAEQAIAGLKAQFALWVKGDIDSIAVHFEAAKASADPKVCAESLEELRRVAHNIKGQGGTFGCYALSEAAAELDQLLKRRCDATALPAAADLIAKLTSAFAREVT